uniref:Putative secreted protein n=1 Tax=Ixodes ricinus TaxID=34613 RepID=A0A6B0U329_IXORI
MPRRCLQAFFFSPLFFFLPRHKQAGTTRKRMLRIREALPRSNLHQPSLARYITDRKVIWTNYFRSSASHLCVTESS